MTRPLRFLLALCALVAVAAIGPSALRAAPPASPSAPAPDPAPRALPTVVQDDAELLTRPAASVRASLARLQSLGVDTIRVTASWSILTRSPDNAHAPDFDQSDPAAYEQHRWANIDRVVRLAPQYGLGVMLDVAFWAPRWASTDPPGTLHPKKGISPTAYARFATAVARRYSGSFVVPGTEPIPPPAPDPGPLGGLGLVLPLPPPFGPTPVPAPPPGAPPLPAVRILTLWNEPNEPAFIGPQWRTVRGVPVPASPDLYRRMVAAAYPAIKRVEPSDVVLVGGLSPHGRYRVASGDVPPLQFLRRLACVDAHLRPVHDGACAHFRRVPGDGWSQHPYQLDHTPGYHSPATEPDNAGVGDLGRLTGLLGRLAGAGRVSQGMRDVYVTEFGYESNPPDHSVPWSLGAQARFLAWSEYLAQRNRHLKMWAQYELRDGPLKKFAGGPQARAGYGGFQMGLLFADGRDKPAAAEFAAGLFVGQRRAGRLLLWGRVRARPGAVAIQVQFATRGRHDWRGLVTAAAPGARGVGGFGPGPGGVFQRYAHAPSGHVKYRLSYLSQDIWHASPSTLGEPIAG